VKHFFDRQQHQDGLIRIIKLAATLSFSSVHPVFSKPSVIQNVSEPRCTRAFSYSDQFLTRYNVFGRDCVRFRLGINQTYTVTPLLSSSSCTNAKLLCQSTFGIGMLI
jgi:hypothetical protein